MLAIAAPGIKVSLEGKPRDYITDTPPEGEAGYTVPDTAYYLRRISDGDLIEVVPAAEAAPAAESAPAKTKKGGA
jgi:hypothetical protein